MNADAHCGRGSICKSAFKAAVIFGQRSRVYQDYKRHFLSFSIISLWPLSKDSVKSAIIFLILAGACQYPLSYKRKRNREYEEQIPNGQFLVQNVKAVKLVNSGVYGIRTRVRNLNGEKLKGIAGIPMAEASKLLKQSQRKGVSIRRWAERPICVA